MTTSIELDWTYRRRKLDHDRLVNRRLEVLRRLLRRRYVNVDTSFTRRVSEAMIRQYAPTLDANTVLYIIDPSLEQWGWRVVDVWECYDAPRPYERFVQIRLAVPGE